MAGRLMPLRERARRSTFAFAVSKTKLTATLVVATLLQTRAPTGKRCGPAAGLLLSRPMMFQVIGETVSVACAASGVSSTKRTDVKRFKRIWRDPRSSKLLGKTLAIE